MSTSTNSTLFGPDSSSSEVASSSVFEAAHRVHYSTSPTSSSFASYRPQHSRQNSRDPAFSSDTNGNSNGNSFLPSLVSDPSSHQQSRTSSFSSTTSASSASTSYSERHDHHPHFYHEQQKASEPAAYGYQRNHSQHIYQAHANNGNNNNNNDAQQSPSSHLLPQLPAEPFALYPLNQHHHNNGQLSSSSPRRASKNGDGVFGGIMPDHNDDHQGIPLGSSSSRPIHSRQSPQTPPLTPSPRKHDGSPPLQGHHPHHPQQYHGQHHHPAGGVGHRQATGAGVRGGLLGPVSSASHAEKAIHKVLTHEPGCVKSRRLAHILSEQKRREKINGGFDELKSVIPDCAQNTDSKATILRKATAYILMLEEELKRYSDTYPRPSDDLAPPPSSSHHQDYMHRQ
ncbi:hypothetical protein KI688_001302 [Linnemannia hyalina]|uniref:BHLH domain-containing protein n=1 Tax=Linnemannia hyalina TaxID=64524 RepID=A0A9P8BSA6_9FUNG|nr:hypothetical protein KI688_001302 [Linnemannia hyalina]